MNLAKFLAASALAGIFPIHSLADDFTVLCLCVSAGPVSPYYLDNGRNIYVVQGTSVVYSFPLTYGGDEGVLAVSSTVNTRPEFTGTTDYGGQYTLTGTPTGVQEPYPLPAGLISEVSYDGTSSGLRNYYVEHYGVSGAGLVYGVYATDLTWQNPVGPLFSLPPSLYKYEGIAYDAKNNSLWISGGDTISDYSLTGGLLFSFPAPSYAPPIDGVPPSGSPFDNSALGYDQADDTLWISYGGTNLLEQYSTTGILLQYGTPGGLPGDVYDFYQSGDFAATPEESSVLLLATVAGAVFCSLRARTRLARRAR